MQYLSLSIYLSYLTCPVCTCLASPRLSCLCYHPQEGPAVSPSTDPTIISLNITFTLRLVSYYPPHFPPCQKVVRDANIYRIPSRTQSHYCVRRLGVVIYAKHAANLSAKIYPIRETKLARLYIIGRGWSVRPSPVKLEIKRFFIEA